MSPPHLRTSPEDQQRDATKHLTFSEREANRDANENFKLGRAAARKKDHAAAMLHFHMALKLQREIMGHEHPVVATTLNAIGLTLMEAGDISVSFFLTTKRILAWSAGTQSSNVDVASFLSSTPPHLSNFFPSNMSDFFGRCRAPKPRFRKLCTFVKRS